MTPPAAPRSLPVLAGSAALAMAASLVWIWLPPMLGGLSAGRLPEGVSPAGPQLLTLSVAQGLMVYLLAATWFATPRYERRGVLSAGAGMLLHTGWLMVNETVAGWRTHPWVKVVPELIGLERHSTLVANLGTAAISVILLGVGAALLVTRPPRQA